MANSSNNLTRRGFLRTACAAGAGAVVGANLHAQAIGGVNVTPTRVLGKTGIKIPILGLGGEFDIVNNQVMLKQAHKLGVRFWDTAAEYANSEAGYGAFFERNPDLRKDIVLSTKTLKREPKGMTAELDASLKALQTDCVDLYFIHRLGTPDELGDWKDEWKAWADQAKKAGKIKFFGVSFHDSVAESLSAVAQNAKWMDVVMFMFNYRALASNKLMKAIDAAEEAKLGMIGIKAQALGFVSRPLSDQEKAAMGRLKGQGYSDWQARLKLLWDSNRVHSACCLMKNLPQLNENAAAAIDKAKLSAADKAAWQQYAQATCNEYCMGCERICGSAVDNLIPVRDILRFLMYHNAYGDRARARRLFAALPDDVRGRLGRVDYSRAERDCPQRMPIGRLMDEAARVLA